MSSELRRRLKAVDPNLNIIPGGTRRHSRKVSDPDWDKAAGVVCSQCHTEVFRIRDGLCMACWEKENEFEIRDPEGVFSLLPKSVIMSIVHPSRKEKSSSD